MGVLQEGKNHRERTLTVRLAASDDDCDPDSLLSTLVIHPRRPDVATSTRTPRMLSPHCPEGRVSNNRCGKAQRRARTFASSAVCALLWACVLPAALPQGTSWNSCSTTAAESARSATRSPGRVQPVSRYFHVVHRLRGGQGSWSPSPPAWATRPIQKLSDKHGDDVFVEDWGADTAAGIFRRTDGGASAWEDDNSNDDDNDSNGLAHDDPLLCASRSRGCLDSEIEMRHIRGNHGRGIQRVSAGHFLPVSPGAASASGSLLKGDNRLDLSSPRFRYRTTGTTIAGILVEVDGETGDEDPGDDPRLARRRTVVVLGADTRATSGRIVADKNASKIHSLASNLFACGAGSSADLIHLTRQAHFTFRLGNLYTHDVGNGNVTFVSSGSHSPSSELTSIDDDTNLAMAVNIHSACRWLQSALYEQGGTCQANLIVGGVQVPDRSCPEHSNLQGPRVAVLRAIHPHGSSDDVPYAALGSGGLAAMAVLESRYRPRVDSIQDAIRLVTDAIRAGISNDLGSGSSIDLCILDAATGRATHIRSAVPEEALPSSPPVALMEGVDSKGIGEAEAGSMPGVNGFGNVPFAIRTARTLQSYDDVNGDIESAWDEVLGFVEPIERREQ